MKTKYCIADIHYAHQSIMFDLGYSLAPGLFKNAKGDRWIVPCNDIETLKELVTVYNVENN